MRHSNERKKRKKKIGRKERKKEGRENRRKEEGMISGQCAQ